VQVVNEVGLGRRGPAESGRLEVLDAAATVFMERGFTATSVDDIAEVLGSTKGRIYHYYRSKTDIFLDVLMLAMRDLLERVQVIAAQREMSPTERLQAAARMHAMVMMNESARSRVAIQGAEMHLMRDAGAKQREALGSFVRMRDEYEQFFAEMVQEGVVTGEFRPVEPRLAAKPVLGALNWINMWYRPRPGEDVSAIADEFALFVVQGLRPVAPAKVTRLRPRRVGRAG
jgi:AcrR family transcriptional regulator